MWWFLLIALGSLGAGLLMLSGASFSKKCSGDGIWALLFGILVMMLFVSGVTLEVRGMPKRNIYQVPDGIYSVVSATPYAGATNVLLV